MAAMCLALAACGGMEAPEAHSTPSPPDVEGLSAEITRLIGAAACEQESQCRVIGVGHKPCGGPASYRAYSLFQIDLQALRDAVSRFNRAEEAGHQRDGAISDCAIVPEPPVRCVDGRCVPTVK